MTSRAIIRLGGLSLAGARWIGWLGVLTAALGLVGMFRNVTRVVASIAAVNNYLLPAFMIILGVALSRWPAGSARRSDANPEEEGVTNK